MKKIAILNDIHGNLYLLKKVLEDLKNEKIDLFIIGGDFLTDGPDSKKIIEIINSLPSITINGNREISILKYQKNKKEKDLKNKPMFYTYESLDEDDLNFLKNNQITKNITINNYNICLSHGTPYDVREFVYPSSKEIFDSLIKTNPADIYLFAHTHISFKETYQGKLFINAGAINTPLFEVCKSCYGILYIYEEYVTYEQRKIKYDFNEVKEYYLNSTYYKDNKEWVNLILYSLKSGYNYYCDFSQNYDQNKSYEQNFQEFMKKNKLLIL